ncbi:TIR domain-containing protein, partial [Nakamurella silvestris]
MLLTGTRAGRHRGVRLWFQHRRTGWREGAGGLVKTGGKKDFFVSYTWANKEWAEWIAVRLERAGYSTVVQAFDFAPGSDFVHEMQKALIVCARMVAVLSPAYLASEMAEAEWRAVFATDPSGEQRLLVPVRVQKFDDSGLLRARVYVDLVDTDEEEAAARLLAGVDVDRPRPTTAAFPGGKPAGGPALAAGETAFPGAGPSVSNLPARNRVFSGREQILTGLYRRLADQRAAALVPAEALSGLGGVGKTSLALEFAHRFSSDYDTVWWIPAEEPAVAAQALADLGPRLGLPEIDDVTEAVRAVHTRLRNTGRWLLVFDNAETPEQVQPLVPASGGGQVLLTSRWPSWRGHAGTADHGAVEVGVWERGESVTFLAASLPGRPEPQLNSLAEMLGDLPLALEEAVAYLHETGEDLGAYLVLLDTRFAELFHLAGAEPAGTEGGGQDRRTVAAVWSVALDRVRDTAPSAEDLLNLLAHLAPDTPRNLPAEHTDALPDPLGTAVADGLQYNEVLKTLGVYALVTSREGVIGVHRLVQAVTRERLAPDDRQRWAGTAVRLVAEAFPASGGQPENWAACETLLPHALAAVGHAEHHAAEPRATSSLLGRAGTYLRGRGQYRQAAVILGRALAIAEEALGPDHP